MQKNLIDKKQRQPKHKLLGAILSLFLHLAIIVLLVFPYHSSKVLLPASSGMSAEIWAEAMPSSALETKKLEQTEPSSLSGSKEKETPQAFSTKKDLSQNHLTTAIDLIKNQKEVQAEINIKKSPFKKIDKKVISSKDALEKEIQKNQVGAQKQKIVPSLSTLSDKKIYQSKKPDTSAEKTFAEKKELPKKKRFEFKQAERNAYLEGLLKKVEEATNGSQLLKSSEHSGSPDGDNLKTEYIGRISSLIRSKTVYQPPTSLNKNLKTVMNVTLSNECRILTVTLEQSSGLSSWDLAVEQAIRKSDPMPRMRDGTCPKFLQIEHALK